MKGGRGGGPTLPLSCLPAAAHQLQTVHPNISEAAQLGPSCVFDLGGFIKKKIAFSTKYIE